MTRPWLWVQLLFLGWLAVPGSLASELGQRPPHPHEAPLGLEGLVRSHGEVILGEVRRPEPGARAPRVELRCSRALKGSRKAGESLFFTAPFAWRRLSGTEQVLAFLGPLAPGSAGHVGNGGVIGSVEYSLDAVAQIRENERKYPTGRIRALGIHLSKPEISESTGIVRLSYYIRNFSTVRWTVHADSGAADGSSRGHRTIAFRITDAEKTEAARTPMQRLSAIVYESPRSSMPDDVTGEDVIDSRPAAPDLAVLVSLPPRAHYTGALELRPVAGGPRYAVYLNGELEKDQGCVLAGGSRLTVLLTLDEDPRYYRGNGALIPHEDYWFGRIESNPVVLEPQDTLGEGIHHRGHRDTEEKEE